MDECIPRCMPADLMQKLHALAERRRVHFAELQESGRWTRYYSQEGMDAQIKKATDEVGQWQKLCESSSPPEA
jgi:hypothetical protein